jgi:hypothetical protein
MESSMRYTRLATYDVLKGNFRELTGLAAEGIRPLLANEPGFLDYGLIDAGHNKVVSISIWATREDAQKSAILASSWVKEAIPGRLRLVTSYVGDLALFHGQSGAVL